MTADERYLYYKTTKVYMTVVIIHTSPPVGPNYLCHCGHHNGDHLSVPLCCRTSLSIVGQTSTPRRCSHGVVTGRAHVLCGAGFGGRHNR